jgi:uncharacterized protein (UPF0548 family)
MGNPAPLPDLRTLCPLGVGLEVRTRRVVGRGPDAFERAADAVVTWRMHRGAWVGVTRPDGRSAPPAALGDVVHVALGPRVLRLGGTCRVLDVGRDAGSADGADGVGAVRRAWLTYAAERDHVEDGVERYVVELDAEGRVWGEVQAWSQPRLVLARHAGNLPLLAPHLITLRYLTALRRAARR